MNKTENSHSMNGSLRDGHSDSEDGLNHQSYTPMQPDDAYEQLGGFGKFQTMVATNCIVLLSVGSQYFYTIPFFIMNPILMIKPGTKKPYTLEEACGLVSDGNIDKYIDWASEFTLKNWNTNLNLTCDGVTHPWKIGLIGTFSFVGIATGAATLGRLADYFGRCRMLKIVTSFIILCLYLTMVVNKIV